jgi:hypothetical protein
VEKRNYSQTGDFDILFRVQKERIIRDGDLSRLEIMRIKEKFQPWIEAGIVCREKRINPGNPPELESLYSLTELGKERLLEFQHYGF